MNSPAEKGIVNFYVNDMLNTFLEDVEKILSAASASSEQKVDLIKERLESVKGKLARVNSSF